MVKIAFTVHGKPVGQGRPRTTVRNGRAIIYKPETSKRYEAEIAKEAKNAMGETKPFTGPVSLELSVYKAPPSGATKKQREDMLKGEIFPTTKPDLDNVIKAVADALTGVVWEDDKQVVMIDAAQYFAEEPLVKIEVADIVEKLN